MRRSFRWRLRIWYGATLILVIGSFASLLYWNARASRLGEIDSQLLGGAQLLAAAIRGLPPHELTGDPPPPRDQPPRDRPRGPREGAGNPAGQTRGSDRPERPPERTENPERSGDAERPGDARRPRPPRRPPPDGFEPPPEMTRRHVTRVLAELKLPKNIQPPPDDPAGPAYFLIWRTNGQLLKASAAAPRISSDELPRRLAEGEYLFENRRDTREVALGGPDDSRILVGRSIGRERNELNRLALQLIVIGAAVTAAGMLGGALLARRVVRPLEEMSAAAAAISATNLSQRIDPTTFDEELQGLAGTLNAAFERLEAAFERQSRFTADASHELRTPLAVLSSHLQFALSRETLDADQRETLEACQRAARRMRSLVDALLLLARADAGGLSLIRQPCDLAGIVEECAEMLGPLAEEMRIQVTVDADACEVDADPALLGQLVMNLLTNAIHHNEAGGSVFVSVRTSPPEAVLVVEDSGPGIPPADQAHLFERFYRVDKARSRQDGGNGLGLAIAKSIVDAHHGEIALESQPGQGSRFTVRLPLRVVGATAAAPQPASR